MCRLTNMITMGFRVTFTLFLRCLLSLFHNLSYAVFHLLSCPSNPFSFIILRSWPQVKDWLQLRHVNSFSSEHRNMRQRSRHTTFWRDENVLSQARRWKLCCGYIYLNCSSQNVVVFVLFSLGNRAKPALTKWHYQPTYTLEPSPQTWNRRSNCVTVKPRNRHFGCRKHPLVIAQL